MDDLDRIARVCHEAVRAYKQALGEEELPPWDEAPEWQAASMRAAVRFRLENPGSSRFSLGSSV